MEYITNEYDNAVTFCLDKSENCEHVIILAKHFKELYLCGTFIEILKECNQNNYIIKSFFYRGSQYIKMN